MPVSLQERQGMTKWTPKKRLALGCTVGYFYNLVMQIFGGIKGRKKFAL